MSAHSIPTIDECRAEIERLRSEHVIHAERRFVRNPPADLYRMVRASDYAANQLRRRDGPGRLERITTWAAIGLASMICIYFAAQFLRLAL